MADNPIDPVDVEVRDPSAAEDKPQSSLTDREAVYALGDRPQQRPWWRRHAFKLCFLLGWILFPFWWGASIFGFRKRHTLKGWERAAWIASIFLSLAGLIIFLIFIIWYGADPEGEKKRLLHRGNGGATQITSSGDTVLSTFGVKMSGACSDTKYDDLVNSVQAKITLDPSFATNANSLTFSRGQPCYTSSSRRHLLLSTVSNYEVLVSAKSGSSLEVQQQLFTSLQALGAAGGTAPPWCGQFCISNSNSILSTSWAAGDDYVHCDKASNGGAYSCKSGTLIASNYANKNSPSDAACCTTCASYPCPVIAPARTGVTLGANQEPSYELCCNPCATIDCGSLALSPVTPAPALDNTTDATDTICCVQAPVVAPTMTLTLAAPGCNATTADALAANTLSSMIMTSNLDPAAQSTIDVKGTCTTISDTRRRLHDDHGNAVQLICGVKGVKTPQQAFEGSKALLKCLGFSASDVANATDPQKVADVLRTLKQNSGAIGHLMGILELAKQGSGLNVSTDPAKCIVSPATLKNAVCPGQPSLSGVNFPKTCASSDIAAECSGSCKDNKIGMFTSTCGPDGQWTTPSGSCQDPNAAGVTKKSCTGSPANVTHADVSGWIGCSGKDQCSINCTSGYMGSPTVVCNLLTGQWSQPSGDCVLVKCPTPSTLASLPNPAATNWPSACSLMGGGSSCNATCKTNAVGNPPHATCVLAQNGNSASWQVTNQGKCFAEDTCTSYTSKTLNGNTSAICTNSSLNYLQSNVSCWDPAAGPYITGSQKNCTADICCRAPKTCGATPNITCNAVGSKGPRLLASTICGESGTDVCTVASCCAANDTCGSSFGKTYESCIPPNTTVRASTLCGLGTGNDCSRAFCCAPATCATFNRSSCEVGTEPLPSNTVCSTGVCNPLACCRPKTCGTYTCNATGSVVTTPDTVCTGGVCNDTQCVCKAGTLLSSYSLKLRVACSDVTYNSLVSSVSTAVTSAAQAAGINSSNLLVTRGGPCTETPGTVSNYQVLVLAVQGASIDVQPQLANTLSTLDAGADPLTPSWCGSFCSDNKQNVAEPPTSSLGVNFKRCSSYTCQSGTLLANKIVSGNTTDSGCCTACTSDICPAPATLLTNPTLAANQTPSFEACCDACANITCPLGELNPPPPLDNTTTPTEALCCVPETVAAPAVTIIIIIHTTQP